MPLIVIVVVVVEGGRGEREGLAVVVVGISGATTNSLSQPIPGGLLHLHISVWQRMTSLV